MVLKTDLEEAAESRHDLSDAEDVYDESESVPLSDVFDDEFVREYTTFATFDELVSASPSDADAADELAYVSFGDWDEFIAESTDFDDEEAFVMAGRDHWVAKRLDLA